MRHMPPVEFYRHNIGDEEKARVLDVLNGRILTTGQAVAEAEAALADYLGIEHVVCLDSCTGALHLALVANGIGPGDEVIVPAMTFVATANAVLMAGATPVIADVDSATGCITPETVRPHISSRAKAIVPVHLYGLLCDMEGLRALADDHELLLIEDSAHCIEARRGQVRPATHGDCACLSFYATKNITCGEGGALVTRDAELAACVRRLATHGMTTSAYDRYGRKYEHWDMPMWGWKYNLDNVRASLLLPQIRRLDESWRSRVALADRYERAVAGIDGVRVPRVDEPEASARHLFTIWVDAKHRDEILLDLQSRGIGVAVNYRAIHLLEYYRNTLGYRRGMLPNAERIGDSTISIPFYTQLGEDEFDRVVAAIRAAVGTHRPTVAAIGRC